MSFEYFLFIHQVCLKWTAKHSILLRSMTLNIQILDSTIDHDLNI